MVRASARRGRGAGLGAGGPAWGPWGRPGGRGAGLGAVGPAWGPWGRPGGRGAGLGAVGPAWALLADCPRRCRVAGRHHAAPWVWPEPWLAVRPPRPAIASRHRAKAATRVVRRGGGAWLRARAGGPRSRPVPPTPRPGIVGGTSRLQRTAVGAARRARTAMVCWAAAAGRGSGSKPATRSASRPVRRLVGGSVRAGSG